jgi:hypothetical protein
MSEKKTVLQLKIASLQILIDGQSGDDGFLRMIPCSSEVNFCTD